jgi:hypothetical protein
MRDQAGDRPLKPSDVIRLPDPRKDVRVGVRQVVRDLDGKPWLLTRVKLTGWHFPQRAALPFMLIGDVLSDFVEISPDGLSAAGYFSGELPHARQVSVGWGRVISDDFEIEIDPGRLERLDPEQLPPGTGGIRRAPVVASPGEMATAGGVVPAADVRPGQPA